MAKVTIKGFIYRVSYSSLHDDERYRFLCSDDQSDEYYTLVGPCEFEYEVPADFNPVAAQVAALEKKKAEIRAEFNLRITQINDKISKLQCLEFTPGKAD